MKTKSTVLILFISFFMLTGKLYAQMGQGKPEEITDMKHRKLIVVLMPENHAVIEKLTKKGHTDLIPRYQKIISDFNDNLKIVFDNNWPYKQQIEYKQWSEVRDLKKAGSKDYAVIFAYQAYYSTKEYDNGKWTSVSYFTPYLDWNYRTLVKGGDFDKDDKDFYKDACFLRLTLIEEINKSVPIAITGLANTFPDKSDIVAGIYGLKWYCDKREAGLGPFDMLKEMKIIPAKLKTETLLIRESDLSPKFPKSSVKSAYLYKYKVVADSILERNIIDKTEATAFIVTVPGMNGVNIIYSQQIFECATGDWFGSIQPSLAGAAASAYVSDYAIGIDAGRSRIDEKVFEKLLEQINK